MHSVLNNLNSDPKVHFWVSFGILTYKSNSILRMFSDLIIVGNPVLRSKVVDVAPNPHLNQVKRALKAAYPPVCCSWWRAHSFHHVLQAADWPASALDRFSMTGRYGTRYAAPSLSRPKCCFSPFASQFWKDSCSVKNRPSEKLFWFFMWNLKKERCFTRLENDWGSNSGKKAKFVFSFVKMVYF